MLLMMCFTKENAALVVLGYYGVRILCRFIFVSLSRARELKTFADKSYQIVKMDFDVPSEVDDEEISEDKEKKEAQEEKQETEQETKEDGPESEQ